LAAKLHQGHATGSWDIQNGQILSGQPTVYVKCIIGTGKLECWNIIGRTAFVVSGSRSPSPVKNQSVAGSRSPSPAKSKSRSPSPHDEDAQSNSGSERSARASDNEERTSVKSGADDDDKSGLFMNYELVGSYVVVIAE